MRILLADDHALFRSGLKRILEDDLRNVVVGEAVDGAAVRDLITKQEWDLLILDISLGADNGLNILPDLKKIRPGLPVLILSMYKDHQLVSQAMRAGASGYLTKDRAPHELLRAIEVVVTGKRFVDESVAGLLADHLASDPKKPPHETLSEREMEVFLLIASAKSVSEIATGLCLSVKTISTYRTRILEKMGLNSSAELMHYAISRGLVKPSL